MKEIRLKKSVLTLLEEGIIHIHLLTGCDITLPDAVRIVETMGALSAGKKLPVLIDVGEFTSVDKEVRIFSASRESNLYTIADGIVYRSFAQKLIADFYIKHNHPVVPTQAFPRRQEALNWLKTFILPTDNNHNLS